MDWLEFTWSHLDSLALTWTHLISLGLNEFTWFHLDSLGCTSSHLISLRFTWTHLISFGLTWSHLDSLDLIISREREHLISQGKREGIPCLGQKGKGKSNRMIFWDPFWPYIQLCAHARMKRNDFPVGLSPPTSDIYLYIYTCISTELSQSSER